MKKIAFLTLVLFSFFACQNEQDKEVTTDDKEAAEATTTDSLPEGKWNGEYLKIEDGEKDNRAQKQSFGSEMYSMGTLKFFIEKDTINFTSYAKRKTALIFTTTEVRAFIRSSFNEEVQLFFKKDNIITKGKGKYKADPTGTVKNGVKITMNVKANNEIVEYVLENGEVELINFDPQMSRLHLLVNGGFKNKAGDIKKGNGEIDILFEEAIMAPN